MGRERTVAAFVVVLVAACGGRDVEGTCPPPVGVVEHDDAGADAVSFGSPVLDACEPRSGPLAGGTLVTCSGRGLAGVVDVDVEAREATARVVDDHTLVFVTPPAAHEGAGNIVVRDAAGATSSAPWTYDP